MTIGRYQTPGVYRQDIYQRLPASLRTGIPLFLGLAACQPGDEPALLTLWPQFEAQFGAAPGYLGDAVRGFFANGGLLCYVLRMHELSEERLRAALTMLASFEGFDLICAPDIALSATMEQAAALQSLLLEHCNQMGDRFAILDSWREQSPKQVLAQRRALRGQGMNGALYYPWVGVADPAAGLRFVPPCGHIAGVYSRSDRWRGVHGAPANELLDGVLDLPFVLRDAEQAELNPAGVNCIRSFGGRGIRVWGARTLSAESAWIYIGVRRLFITAGRWIKHNMSAVAFEPNNMRLWARISRELTFYFTRLFEQGALRGAQPQEAFYVKCDADTNPPELREQGLVVTEIGLAPAFPAEFVVVRIVHGASGVTLVGPERPA